MRTVLLHVAVCWLAILAGCATQQAAEKGEKLQYVETDTGRWLIHDVNRPAPAVITPGTESTQVYQSRKASLIPLLWLQYHNGCNNS